MVLGTYIENHGSNVRMPELSIRAIKMNPTIALIIPTYQAAQDIPELMPAIMRQSLQPKHILVIDSSSTDNTRELLASYPVTLHTI